MGQSRSDFRWRVLIGGLLAPSFLIARIWLVIAVYLLRYLASGNGKRILHFWILRFFQKRGVENIGLGLLNPKISRPKLRPNRYSRGRDKRRWGPSRSPSFNLLLLLETNILSAFRDLFFNVKCWNFDMIYILTCTIQMARLCNKNSSFECICEKPVFF